MSIKRLIFIVALFLFVIALVAWVINKEKEGQQASPPVQPSDFRGLRPGTSTEQNIASVLGSPLRDEPYAGGKTLVYLSAVEKTAITIDTDTSGVVSLVKEPLLRTSLASFSGFGNADIVLYGDFSRQGFQLQVFLSRGTALLANPTTGEVRERWYFPVVSAQIFQSKFAPNFLTSPVPEGQD